MMHETLIQYINAIATTPLTEKKINIIKNIFPPRRIRSTNFFSGGDVCKYMGFIIRSAMRQYSVDDKGSERIIRLQIENWWVGDRETMPSRLMPSLP